MILKREDCHGTTTYGDSTGFAPVRGAGTVARVNAGVTGRAMKNRLDRVIRHHTNEDRSPVSRGPERNVVFDDPTRSIEGPRRTFDEHTVPRA
ncbi:MAG: hypothetical protein CBB77_09380 [Hyphomonas sp. TMED17]|nr:MAG: hypothetical protein CBB77_09380 [Hyphomonas sp. TMED17]